MDQRGPGRFMTLLSIGVGAPLAAALRALGVWFMPLGYESRIGHMIAETLAASMMHKANPRKFRVIISAARPETSANPDVMRRLKGIPVTVPKGTPRKLSKLLAWHPLSRLPTGDWVSAYGRPALIFRYADLIGSSDLLQRTAEDVSHLTALKRRLGIDESIPYVTLQVREQGYSLYDDAIHEFRNADVKSYMAAVDWLVHQGYAVIRVGGAEGTPWPRQPGLIDYSHSEFSSPRGDLLLLGGAEFMIGNTSGLHCLATVQNVPVVGVNMAPISAFGLLGANCIAIPKLYCDASNGRLMDFASSLSGRTGHMRSSQEFEAAGVSLRSCSDDEILAVVSEMHLRVRGQWHEDPEDARLQERFRECLTEESYSLLSSTRIGAAFLRKHQGLLP